jgi:hypothetical protein
LFPLPLLDWWQTVNANALIANHFVPSAGRARAFALHVTLSNTQLSLPEVSICLMP